MCADLRSLLIALTFATSLTAGSAGAVAATAVEQPRLAPSPISADDAYWIARRGYDFLFPLVTMDVTRRAFLTVGSEGERPKIRSVNSLVHVPATIGGSARTVVGQNFDMLISSAWIDVSKGPVTLTIGAGADRFYLLPMLDMWTDVFAVPGTRTLGSGSGRYLIVSKTWRGVAPADTEVIRAPTDMVWMIGRFQNNGPGDIAHVNGLQHLVELTPSVQPPPAPEIDTALDRKITPRKIMETMTPDAFLAHGARLSGLYPPHEADQPIMGELARIGFRPGKPYVLAAQPEAIQSAIRRAFADELASIEKAPARDAAATGASFKFSQAHLGAFGGDYRYRAIVALVGLAANRPEDAIYGHAVRDGDGELLSGKNSYVVHFNKGMMPPDGAFWSIAAYDLQGFGISTPENRNSVGSRDNLVANPDGSLDVYIGQHAPDDPSRRRNWLPVAADGFYLSMRIYNPRPEAIDGRWVAPPVLKAKP